MAKLKIGPLIEEKPARLTIDLPGPVHRDLAPMLARFMATDRVFVRGRNKI